MQGPITFASVVNQIFSFLGFGPIISSTFLTLFERLEWFLLATSLAFLIVIIYLKLRLAEVEHAGWNALHTMEEKVQGDTQPKNPRWEQIVALIGSANENDWRRAILEADIMLGQMLTERGFIGEDIGEQLRGASRSHFTTLDNAWEAHRLRNAIAHVGDGFTLTYRDAQAAIENYRHVFEEFDYI